jgi:hypothetical protein
MAKRTVLYVAVFGLGSLLVIAVLSSAFTSLAQGVLPGGASSSTATVGSALEPMGSASGRPGKTPAVPPGRRRTVLPRPGSSDDPSGLLPTTPAPLPAAPTPDDGSDRSPAPARPAFMTVPPHANEAPRSAGEHPL